MPLAVYGGDFGSLAEEYARMLVAANETNESLIITPAPTSPVEATATTSTIEISFTITGITFTDLSEADKTSIETGIKNKVVADLGVAPSTVTVVLSAGSVKVEITVADAPAAAVTAVAAQDTSTQQTAYIAAVQEVVTANNIAVTGTLGVTGYDSATTEATPVGNTTLAPTATDEGVASAAFSVQTLLTAKLVAAFIGLAFAAMA